MSTLNMDLERAKRSNKKAPTVTFGGRIFTLPKELPFELFVSLARVTENPADGMSSLDTLIGVLFGEEKEAFMAQNPSLEDIMFLFSEVTDQYDVTATVTTK